MISVMPALIPICGGWARRRLGHDAPSACSSPLIDGQIE
jgi:hypothetical protein